MERIGQLVNMLMGGLIAQTSGQVLEMLVADVVLKEYPEAVEDDCGSIQAMGTVPTGISCSDPFGKLRCV